MRTNIEIDDQLIREAMEVTGLRTKKEVVDQGLRALTRIARQQRAIRQMRGIGWEGDLKKMRDDWTPMTDWRLRDNK